MLCNLWIAHYECPFLARLKKTSLHNFYFEYRNYIFSVYREPPSIEAFCGDVICVNAFDVTDLVEYAMH